MSALPSNLLTVGEDLARATARDAERSLRRRRAVTLVVALAILVVTATAAVANGWILGQTTTLRAVPALGPGQSGAGPAPGAAASAIGELAKTAAKHRAPSPDSARAPELGSAVAGTSRTLLTDLGPQERVLSSVATTTGGVCLLLTGFPVQCIPTFTTGQDVAWIVTPSRYRHDADLGPCARRRREHRSGLLTTTRPLPPSSATTPSTSRWTAVSPHASSCISSDGSSDVVQLFPCPVTTPNCAK